MTWPVPPDPAELHRAARWWAGLADTLLEVGLRVGQLSEDIARDWADGGGREWAERSAQLRRELGHYALDAAELAEMFGRRAAAAPDPDAPPVLPLVASVGAGREGPRRGGMQLGGTEASRADDDRGMRIAELPEPGAGSG